MPAMIVVGTRPEIIKMAPVIAKFQEMGIDFDLVHTDQHYDESLSGSFFRQLDLPEPNYHLNVKSGTQAEQTARILLSLEPLIEDTSPDVVLVQGDTNTVLGAGITAVKVGARVGHVEAGLRSRDLRMPEEHNRRIVDHVSSYLFAPTQCSAVNLRREDVWGRITVTGNTIIDALDMFLDKALITSKVRERIPFEEYALVTLHRAENVDDPQTLRKIVKILSELIDLPIVFPIHPRTVARLKSLDLYQKIEGDERILLVEPLPYFDFLATMEGSSFILTDSGGVQEEATHPGIRKPVIVARLSTERPEAVDAGFASVVGFDLRKIRNALDALDAESLPGKSPFGNGKAAQKIMRALRGVLT
ncbi:MAG: UDP-N-acetylglucosamine 2-epimerase (non-hydrolyzing) [Theionarchaea archaeon]|nr:UDP-N-acetylglucosamine 2-epimerase (non-hydrolyzing) [Theionarchaea archaeon]